MGGIDWKKPARRRDRELERLGDINALIGDFECLAVVTLAAASFASDVNVGQEMHVDPRARRRPGTLRSGRRLHVERKAARP